MIRQIYLKNAYLLVGDSRIKNYKLSENITPDVKNID